MTATPRRTALLLFLILATILTAIPFLLRTTKQVGGVVVDCETDQLIAGAKISADQRGWGWGDNGPLWDKKYESTAISDSAGQFVVIYRVGHTARITAEKSGYAKALQTETPGTGAKIRMLKGNSTRHSYTFRCQDPDKCIATIQEHGDQITKNICDEGW